MTLEQLAFESGKISKGHLSDLEKGRLNPTIGSLQALADCLEASLVDLVTVPDASARERLIELTRLLPEALLLRWQEEGEVSLARRVPPSRGPGGALKVHERRPKNGVPLVDLEAAAGALGEGREVSTLGWVALDGAARSLPGAFVAKVVGQSMEPRIPDGSYALFRKPGPGNRSGRVLLVQRRKATDPEHGGSYLLKLFERARQGERDLVRLRSLHPGVDVIELDPVKDEISAVAEFVRVVG